MLVGTSAIGAVADSLGPNMWHKFLLVFGIASVASSLYLLIKGGKP